MRDGPSAVGIAEKAVEATKRGDLAILDTLAAAYAEAGQFAKAVSVQKEAIDLTKEEKMKSQLLDRLRLYESGRPYHEPE